MRSEKKLKRKCYGVFQWPRDWDPNLPHRYRSSSSSLLMPARFPPTPVGMRPLVTLGGLCMGMVGTHICFGV